jgi:hypothetical protein
MACESNVLKAYGIKVWGLSEVWKELNMFRLGFERN